MSLLEVCQDKGGGQKRGIWRTLRVPNQRLGGQGTVILVVMDVLGTCANIFIFG